MKLKLSKKALLFIGIGIFVIALGILGIASFQKASEKNRLETQITSSQKLLQGIKLEPLVSQELDLGNQVVKLAPQLALVKAKLSEPISSTNATAAIFDAARANDLVVMEVTSSSPTDAIVQGVTLSAIQVTAKVVGNLSTMVNFIVELNSRLKTSTIKSVEIIAPAIISGNITTADTGDNRTANISLVIYTYRGE